MNLLIRNGLLYASLFVGVVLHAQPKEEEKPVDAAELNKLKMAIEQNPESLEAHEAYVKATGFTKWNAPENPEFVKQYEEWMKKFPKSATIPYALGHAYASKESPKAKPYLLKAVALDPKFDKAYFDLWIDGERWGDFKLSRSYLAKAKEANPQSADYAFYYANGFSDSDPEKYRALSLEVAKNFPNTERGAQALYWLANRYGDVPFKMSVYEQQKRDFPPGKFSWTSSGMSEYFSLLLFHDPSKAIELAKSMADLKGRDQKTWEGNVLMAENNMKGQALLKEGKGAEAAEALSKVVVPRYSLVKDEIILLKAKASDAAGKTEAAYTDLLKVQAKEPTMKIGEALASYGKKLGKEGGKINEELWYIRDTAAKVAPNFSLDQYFKKGKASLSDFKGKVVLLTYWFPGCGPCRGEFPHFENVVKKFKGRNDFVYLGINITEEQDEYVLPFMKSSGYSFIPLRDNDKWEKGPLNNRNAAPVNFLIDQDGKIVYSNFRTDGRNESSLEMMIASILDKKKTL
jgi:thiol-disulfide isomerase/thioredoxin